MTARANVDGHPLIWDGKQWLIENSMKCGFRWWLYNAAFRLFGHLQCWQWLGQKIWS